MDAIQTTFSKKERNSEAMRAFGYRLKNQFATNEAYRRPKELEWLESLRQYKGLYDPEVQIQPGNSRVYPKITRSKINIVLSRLHEMLFPETDKNWEIGPTPEPRISKDIVTQIAMSLVTVDQSTGTPIIPTADDLKLAIKKYVQASNDAMSGAIDDALTEMDYSEETKKVLRSGLMYGTGILKGPMIKQRTKRRWEPDSTSGDYIESTSTDEVPYMKFVRIWDWYPDMSVTEREQMEGSFERHIMTKHDLRQLAKRTDFYSDMIMSYLTEHPTGDYVAKEWEINLQVIEVEAGAGRNTKASTSASTSFEDSPRSTNRQLGKKYQVLEFWGYVDGSDLEACGVEVKDPELEYAANVWMLGNVPIKAVLFDGALDQYKVFYYEKDETSLFGEGLARVMRHSQLAIAGGARMVLDNGACVTGDTVVYRNHHSADRPPEITVRELWGTKHKHNSGLRRMKIRSVNEETGEIFYNRIVDVYNNGIRPVFEIKTLHGYTIRATEDHRFMSDDGEWSELGQFCIGDMIAVNGKETAPVGKCIDCGAGLSKPGALRCRSCASKKENSTWNAKQALDAENSNEATNSTARQRWACQRDKKTYCERCGAKSEAGIRLCIHHVDGDPHNNVPENKITCCQPCHMAIHRRNDYFGQPKQHIFVDYDEIESIEYIGEEEVFDLELTAPNHNFVANGFVVHNCISGPQVECNISLLAPGTDYNSFYPRKIWYREGRGVDAQYPAVRPLEFASHIPELLSIIEAFKQFGDEETTLPTWMIGQMVNNETAQATSGRMATITISIKDVVKNFDAFTEKVIRDLYAWFMEFSDRTDIKGDYEVKAKGVSSLVMKEIRMQALNQLATTMTPEDWVYLDRRDFLKERFKAHDINIPIKSEEEADKIREAQQNSLQMKLAVSMQEAEIAYKKSQTMAQLTKAKKVNTEATKDAQTPIEQPNGDDPRLVDQDIAKKQAEIDDIRTKSDLSIQKANEEIAQLRQKGEESKLSTVLDLAHKQETHQTDLEIKKKTADHGMKMKEKAIKLNPKPKAPPKSPKPKSTGGK